MVDQTPKAKFHHTFKYPHHSFGVEHFACTFGGKRLLPWSNQSMHSPLFYPLSNENIFVILEGKLLSLSSFLPNKERCLFSSLSFHLFIFSSNFLHCACTCVLMCFLLIQSTSDKGLLHILCFVCLHLAPVWFMFWLFDMLLYFLELIAITDIIIWRSNFLYCTQYLCVLANTMWD